MTKALWAFAVLALLSVGYGVWEGHKDAADWVVWKADRQRILAQKDSAVRVADSLVGVVNRKDSAAKRLTAVATNAIQGANRLRDSLSHLPSPPDTCRIWLQMAAGRADSLQVATDSLLAANDSLRGANALLQRSVVTLKQPVIALTHLVETVPKGCHLLFLPCPTITGGYGATLSGGRIYTGPSVTAGWRITF